MTPNRKKISLLILPLALLVLGATFWLSEKARAQETEDRQVSITVNRPIAVFHGSLKELIAKRETLQRQITKLQEQLDALNQPYEETPDSK